MVASPAPLYVPASLAVLGTAGDDLYMTQVTLADLGVFVQRRFLSSTGDDTIADAAELTEVVFTLPRGTAVQATFTREIDGARVTVEMPGRQETTDVASETLVRVLVS